MRTMKSIFTYIFLLVIIFSAFTNSVYANPKEVIAYFDVLENGSIKLLDQSVELSIGDTLYIRLNDTQVPNTRIGYNMHYSVDRFLKLVQPIDRNNMRYIGIAAGRVGIMIVPDDNMEKAALIKIKID